MNSSGVGHRTRALDGLDPHTKLLARQPVLVVQRRVPGEVDDALEAGAEVGEHLCAENRRVYFYIFLALVQNLPEVDKSMKMLMHNYV